jgi:hypothetical protein
VGFGFGSEFDWFLDMDVSGFIIYKEGRGGTRVSRLDYVVGCVRSDGSVQ